MNEKLFDDTVEKATEKHINQLEVYSSPIKTYEPYLFEPANKYFINLQWLKSQNILLRNKKICFYNFTNLCNQSKKH